jgi:hypothetical protein
MKLFTQNSDLRKTGIFGWTLPAHWVKLSDGSKFNTCPNAGICAAFCYAKNGTYMFSNVKKVHLEKLELVLFQREKWKSMINEELKLKKYNAKYIRIHDAGDFFDKQYALDWIEIAKNNKQCIFYSYTKEVSLFKSIESIPENFILIYSFGGKEDHLIDRNIDRHSDVFPNYDEMVKAGYNDIAEDDKQAAINVNFKVGLYRNNIKHFIKKMGDKKFSEWQKGERPTKNTLF